jgi:acetoin utilization deacetylase AcuC-like enzyme
MNGIHSFRVVAPVQATYEQLTEFHSKKYIDALKNANVGNCFSVPQKFGLGYDCELFEGYGTSCPSFISLQESTIMLHGLRVVL